MNFGSFAWFLDILWWAEGRERGKRTIFLKTPMLHHFLLTFDDRCELVCLLLIPQIPHLYFLWFYLPGFHIGFSVSGLSLFVHHAKNRRKIHSVMLPYSYMTNKMKKNMNMYRIQTWSRACLWFQCVIDIIDHGFQDYWVVPRRTTERCYVNTILSLRILYVKCILLKIPVRSLSSWSLQFQ